MDREISSNERRNRVLKRTGIFLAGVVVVLAALWALLGWLRPSVRLARPVGQALRGMGYGESPDPFVPVLTQPCVLRKIARAVARAFTTMIFTVS